MGEQLYLWAFKYYVYDSNVKYCDLKDFLKAQFAIFSCQTYVKKSTWKLGEQLYLEPLKSAPGRSILQY